MNATDRDDTAQKIAEILEALEKETPGPWKYEMWEGCAERANSAGRFEENRGDGGVSKVCKKAQRTGRVSRDG